MVLLAAGCASAPPAAAPTIDPNLALDLKIEQKVALMLQLEDRRILAATAPAPSPPAPAPPRGRTRNTVTPSPAPVVTPPDLTTLLSDSEPRVRRRAALAIGRVGLPAGVQPLVKALSDTDPDVRDMAAFALGLIGDVSAAPALTKALTDAAPIVRGRAAEALGLIEAKDKDQIKPDDRRATGEAIGRMVAEYARGASVASMAPDDERWPAPPEAEAFRLGIYALVRLGTYEPLAAAVLDSRGLPVVNWWPVAYALGRIEDRRAAPALLLILNGPGKYSAAFAARGLGVLKDAKSVNPLLTIASTPGASREVVVSAIRALATIGEGRASALLVKLASDASDPNVRLQAVSALGTLKAADGLPIVQDLLSDPWPTMRAAALRAAAAIDPEGFVLVLSGMEPDSQWTVRAALADVLGTLPPKVALERTRSMLRDDDRRVVPSVLNALARLKAPDAATVALAELKEPDFVVRATAARIIGELKPAGGVEALRDALTLAGADAAIDARAAILSALAEYGASAATSDVKTALNDKDWAVRVHAATLLAKLDPAVDALAAMRPAPGEPRVPYDNTELIGPRSRRTCSSKPPRARSNSSWRSWMRRRRPGVS